MPFCYSPWTNIDISPQGDITPCCKFQDHNKLNIQTSTLSDYANSESLLSIKQQFLNDQWPAGCERCRIEEDHGIESKRILDYTRWKQHYAQIDLNNDKFLTASIAFGNTCNLTCITCGPKSSSRWQKEYQTVYGINKPPFHFYKDEFVQDLIDYTPGIIHLDIPGGEPFLSGVTEQKQLLAHYIQTGQSKNISIHYTTNVTVYPDLEWWTLWKHFKEIDMQLSIDGIGQRYEYIRYPAKWNTVLENINRYLSQQQLLNNFRLSVSHTVSAYNIYYLDEFVSWCYTIGLPRPWMGRVHSPAFMRPSVWPDSARKVIVDNLSASNDQDVQQWASLISNTDDSNLFAEFKEKMHLHDQYRALSFANTFPELAAHI
jgi:radical SAM protein with 4Fe4S-binding SPASM domain